MTKPRRRSLLRRSGQSGAVVFGTKATAMATPNTRKNRDEENFVMAWTGTIPQDVNWSKRSRPFTPWLRIIRQTATPRARSMPWMRRFVPRASSGGPASFAAAVAPREAGGGALRVDVAGCEELQGVSALVLMSPVASPDRWVVAEERERRRGPVVVPNVAPWGGATHIEPPRVGATVRRSRGAPVRSQRLDQSPPAPLPRPSALASSGRASFR